MFSTVCHFSSSCLNNSVSAFPKRVKGKQNIRQIFKIIKVVKARCT